MLNFSDLFCSPQTVVNALNDIKMHQDGKLEYDHFLKKSQEEAQPSFVSFENGEPLMAASNSKSPSTANRVAVIPIKGMMQRRFSYFYQATSTEFVRQQIALANAMPDVRSIVLDITSGGGTVSGTYELAEAIRKSEKPVIAAITDLGASAAYWAASAASEVYVTNPLTQVGSIGAITQHYDYSKYLENEGINISFITSKNAEAKAYGNFTEPLEGKAKEAIQRSLNDAEAQFHSAIRRSRGSVLNEDSAFTGQVFNPTVARDLGLIDGVKQMDRILGRALTLGNKDYQDKKKKRKNNSNTNKAMTNQNGLQGFAEFLPTQKVRFSEDITMSAQEATDLYDAFANYKTQLEEANTNVETLNQSIAEANTQIEGLQADVETANSATAEANARIEELEGAATASNEQIEALNARIEELEASANTAGEEANTQLEEANARVEELTASLEEATTATTEANAQVEELNAQVETLNGSITEKDEEITSLQTQLGSAVAENNRLASAYGARNRAAINTVTVKEDKEDDGEQFASKADKAVAKRDLDSLFAMKSGINIKSILN